MADQMNADRTNHALSFGSAADRYDRNRPSYPPAALSWALGDAPLRVVDLGAGTGILSRVLLELGHQVIPVEPDPGMRDQLAARTPQLSALAGSAETIPLPDASVDAVVAGQAYHWFDRGPAHREIARVIRPDGVFVPVWNIYDESVPWVARLVAIIDPDRGGQHYGWLLESDFGTGFSQPERRTFRYEITRTEDSLVALVSTRSHYLTATPDRQAEMLAEVRSLAAELPPSFPLPYLTVAYRATRLG
jgi:SAM-dependent methyltransferase